MTLSFAEACADDGTHPSVSGEAIFTRLSVGQRVLAQFLTKGVVVFEPQYLHPSAVTHFILPCRAQLCLRTKKVVAL